MRRSKQALFCCIMVFMTLAVIEGMAQAAYYIAYGEFNRTGRPPPQSGPAGRGATDAVERQSPVFVTQRVNHPYYGYTRVDADHVMNRVPPPRRQDGVVLIALVGGSLARYVTSAFQDALHTWFQDNGIPQRPVVLGLNYNAVKQPQQAIMVVNNLSLGGEYDIIVNLDGHNELIFTQENWNRYGLSPFFPYGWQLQQQGITGAQRILVSRIDAARQRKQRLDALGAAEPWRRSALYGIVNRYLRERAAARILALNHELADTRFGEYSLQRYGPALDTAPDEYELSRSAVRAWYRGSVLLANLSRAAGAEYYHFQQPNQYVPNSKPLTDRELSKAYDPESDSIRIYRDAYPLLLRLGDELRRQGINYYDLTQIFADNRETLYIDDCCHLNERGYALLAADMVRHLAPALRNRAALTAARVGGGGGGI